MLKLMQQCDEVDKNRDLSKSQELVPFYQKQTASTDGAETNKASRDDSGGSGFQNPLSLFSGVFPGTKWCGTGDIAKNYHDLGTVKSIYRHFALQSNNFPISRKSKWIAAAVNTTSAQ